MGNNWKEFIDAYFSDGSLFKNELYDIDETKIVKVFSLENKNVYIKFEFVKTQPRELLKLEFGSISDQVICKGIFNSNQKHNLEFRQHSWLEEGECFNLIYDRDTLASVTKFLEIPLKHGWSEKQFYFGGNIYKIVIQLELDGTQMNFELIPQSFEEQDLPMVIDRPFRKIYKFLVESIFDKSKIKLKEIKIGS